MQLSSATNPARALHRAAFHAGVAVRPYLRSAAGFALRSRSLVRALNVVEARMGQVVLYGKRDLRVSDVAEFLFHDVEFCDAFQWRCRVGPGAFMVPVDPSFPHPRPRNDPWGPATYWRRVQNRRIRAFYERFLRARPVGTFVDVGANWGMHTYPFAAVRYVCIAFEPQSPCGDFIRRVSKLNGFTNVEVVRAAVGSASLAEVPFYESEVEAFSSIDERHVAAFGWPWRRTTIECVTLDAYCQAHGVAPTVIKIDTEGYEWEVVRGAARVLAMFKPALIVEVSAALENQQRLWDVVAELGYSCYAISRLIGGRYPKEPFRPIRSLVEFEEAAKDHSETATFHDGEYESEADFIFLQPDSDVLAGR